MHKIDFNKNFWKWSAFLLMSFIWGASFILIKKGLMAYTPLQSGALRIMLASSFFIPLSLKRIKYINKSNVAIFIIVGLVGNFFPAFMFAYSETLVYSSVASILNSTTPIFTFIIGILFFSTKINIINILGIIIGFVGALLLILNSNPSQIGGFNIGAVIILIATLLYGLNTNLVKHFGKNIDGLTLVSISFMLLFPLSAAYFLSSDLKTAYNSEFFWHSTLSIAILAFFGSFVANIIFNIFVIKTNAVLASSVTYVIPVFSLLWGFADNEQITFLHFVSIFVIFVGVSLVNFKEKIFSFALIKK